MANWKQVLDEKAKQESLPEVYLMAGDVWQATAGYHKRDNTYDCQVAGVNETIIFDLNAEQVEQHFSECGIALDGNWQ